MESNQNPDKLTLFPFQVPTVGSTRDRSAYTIDWQYMNIYHYKNGRFEKKRTLAQ